MATIKTIAIVGATEKKGAEISSQFARGKYRLLLVSKNNIQLAEVAKNITDNKPNAEIIPLECVKDSCWEADIIFLALPRMEVKTVAEIMKDVATQKIVVILSDERNNDLQKLLPNSKLVTVSHSSTSKQIFISGHDEIAKEEIGIIYNQAGYHSILN